MRMAIAEARKSSEVLKCGVVIVNHNHVISSAYNSQRRHNDATRHAEIKAISKAGKVLGNKNLYGCTMYCTCEPCLMCLSAAVLAKIDTIYYGINLNDIAPKNNFQVPFSYFLARAPHKAQDVS